MIDWSFVSAREGGQILHGYVPNAPGDKSGVTVATGIDLGYYSLSDCSRLPGDLPARLETYIGLTGQRARDALAKNELTITQSEADAIEQPKRSEMLTTLSTHYLRNAAFAFEKIPDAAQTVLMSVLWQYGDLWDRTPRFWGICCKQDWSGAVSVLRHFSDDYPTRRNLEADYLEKNL